MENKKETFVLLKGIYESYFYRKYHVETNLICINYSNDGLKFHEWNISPINVNGHIFSKIRLSDYALTELLSSINSFSIEECLSLNEEILSVSIK